MLFPDEEGGDGRYYSRSWAEFTSLVESRLADLNEQDKKTITVFYEDDYDSGISFRIRGFHIKTDEEQKIRVHDAEEKERLRKRIHDQEIQERDKKEYERLKKKFEPSNSQLSPANGGDPHAERRTSHVPWD